VLYLNADGIGAPAADQEGPIQVGFTVERYGTTREAAAAGAKRNQESATRNPRLKVIKAGKVEELKLSDGTEGAFTRTLLLKEGSRLSLQMKLFAKDKDSRGWVVSAWIVTGKDSKFIENNPGLEQVLKAHMASLCFRPEKLSTDGVAKAHSLLAQSRPASVPASSPATAPA